MCVWIHVPGSRLDRPSLWLGLGGGRGRVGEPLLRASQHDPPRPPPPLPHLLLTSPFSSPRLSTFTSCEIACELVHRLNVLISMVPSIRLHRSHVFAKVAIWARNTRSSPLPSTAVLEYGVIGNDWIQVHHQENVRPDVETPRLPIEAQPY